MTKELKEVRDALTDCRVATQTGCTEHALAFIEKALAVLDTIIADHIPDAGK